MEGEAELLLDACRQTLLVEVMEFHVERLKTFEYSLTDAACSDSANEHLFEIS